MSGLNPLILGYPVLSLAGDANMQAEDHLLKQKTKKPPVWEACNLKVRRFLALAILSQTATAPSRGAQ
jgi:hypothetical protein